MQGLTLSQLQAGGATPIASPTTPNPGPASNPQTQPPTTPPGVSQPGLTLQQLQAGGATPIGQSSASTSAPQPGVFQRIKTGINNTADKAFGAYNGMIQNDSQNLTAAVQGKESPIAAGASAFSNLARPVGKAVSKVFSPVTALEQATQKGTGRIADLLTGRPQGTSSANLNDAQTATLNAYQSWATKNPNASKELEALGNAFNVGGTLAGGQDAVEAAPGVASDIKGALSGNDSIAGRAVQSVSDAGNEAKSAISSRVQSHYVSQAQDEFTKPTTKTGYSKATTIFNNAKAAGQNIGETLVQNKINPSDIIQDGKYNVGDTPDKIRDDAGQASKDMLRPALAKADATTPKTPVEEITNKTVADIKNTQGETAGNIKTQVAKAQAEGAALSEKYPDGMSLTDMHDEKIAYAKNGGYKPVGSVEDNNSAAMNRSFGRTLANEVETKAPADVPVHEFNGELQKQYRAADYLDALDGKKAPVSIASKVAKQAAKGVGAMVGNATGAGILADMAGYNLGGTLEGIVENMSNPVKAAFLRNLETSNPEAFTKVQDYLKK